ncbi:hypothetical protein [Halomarina oriensis]|uniref:Uncharacterized protein n=1 Tax=Halomarina oriensis TaxID=671145 RepID=A0A6B0GVY3_9EURY|nr:hypothetical protein [Halomarina oriensis]MWG35888.1 hypothetical protein [Halomarina oriensis]
MSLAADMDYPIGSSAIVLAGFMFGSVFVTDAVQSLGGSMLHAAAGGFVIGFATMAIIIVLWARQGALGTGGSR